MSDFSAPAVGRSPLEEKNVGRQRESLLKSAKIR